MACPARIWNRQPQQHQGFGVGRWACSCFPAIVLQRLHLTCLNVLQRPAHSPICFLCIPAAVGACIAGPSDDKTHPSRPKAGPCVCTSSSARVQHAHVSSHTGVTTALRGRAAVSMALRFAKATRSKVMSAGSQSRVYRDVNVHKPQVLTTLSSPIPAAVDRWYRPCVPACMAAGHLTSVIALCTPHVLSMLLCGAIDLACLRRSTGTMKT